MSDPCASLSNERYNVAENERSALKSRNATSYNTASIPGKYHEEKRPIFTVRFMRLLWSTRVQRTLGGLWKRAEFELVGDKGWARTLLSAMTERCVAEKGAREATCHASYSSG